MSKEYIEGKDRRQTILLPETLNEYVAEDNPVRVIDAFVDLLDMKKLGFKHAEPSNGPGRAPFDPRLILKILIWGYLNLIRSSRKLETECHRNLELLWLTKKLAPDFKVIADFRKDNIDSIKPVFKEFVCICKALDLFGAELVGIDGSKFKAWNSTDRNFNKEKLLYRLKSVEEGIARYLKEISENDEKEQQLQVPSTPYSSSSESPAAKYNREERQKYLEDKLEKLKKKKDKYESLMARLKATGAKEVSLTDPDSRMMRTGNGNVDVCYNIQSAVDSKEHLIADYDVTNSSSDYNQLSSMAKGAKDVLGVDRLDVTADPGFHDSEEMKECVENGITPYVKERAPTTPNKKTTGVPQPEFEVDKFTYDEESDTYTCPAGYSMNFLRVGINSTRGRRKMRLYVTTTCNNGCPFRARCTTSKRGRIIYRWEHARIMDEIRMRLKTADGLRKLLLRKELVEHPFGSMKRAFNQGYLLLRGLRKVKGEVGFTMLAYNMKRAMNIVGVEILIQYLGQ